MQIFDIACLGTSLTAGSGADFSYQRDLMLALQPGKQSRLRTYNFGIPGGYSSDGVSQMARVAGMKSKVILVEFLMNDCLGTTTNCQSNTTTLVNGLKAASPGSAIFLMTMNPVRSGTAGGDTRTALPTFNDIYRSLYTSLGVGLIDSYPNWTGLNSTNVPDGVHPTAALNKSFLIPAIASAIGSMIE